MYLYKNQWLKSRFAIPVRTSILSLSRYEEATPCSPALLLLEDEAAPHSCAGRGGVASSRVGRRGVTSFLRGVTRHRLVSAQGDLGFNGTTR
ncbi:hypothetical protein GW17_00021783 [Ensete ventricosum]|nr:hypothetical protein GW17_00021783 [Ensete ventricosum]RZS19170.1 hypothetical protein BHM03_00051527 [Ensete ventricosum]